MAVGIQSSEVWVSDQKDNGGWNASRCSYILAMSRSQYLKNLGSGVHATLNLELKPRLDMSRIPDFQPHRDKTQMCTPLVHFGKGADVAGRTCAIHCQNLEQSYEHPQCTKKELKEGAPGVYRLFKIRKYVISNYNLNVNMSHPIPYTQHRTIFSFLQIQREPKAART
jgi:hypothetical protein